MSETNGKRRVNLADLTLGDMAAIEDELGIDLAEVSKFRATAAMIWAHEWRTNKAYTLEDALALKPGELELVDEQGNVVGGDSGDSPPSSPERGP